MFYALCVQLGQDNCHSDTLIGADVFHKGIDLDDAPQTAEERILRCGDDGVLTAQDGEVFGLGAGLDDLNARADDLHLRVGEGEGIALTVRIGDGVVDRLDAPVCADVQDLKAQGRSFSSGCSDRGRSPFELLRVDEDGGAVGRGIDADDLKIGVEHFLDLHIERTGKHHLACHLGKRLVELRGVCGKGNVGAGRSGCPQDEGSGGRGKTDAVDFHSGCLDALGHRDRIAACGRDAVGEHDDDAAGGGGGQEHRFARFKCRLVVGGASGGECIDGGAERCHVAGEPKIGGCGVGKADNPQAAAVEDGGAVGAAACLCDGIDELLCGGLCRRKGCASHAAGAVHDEDDVGGVCAQLGRSVEAEGDGVGSGAAHNGAADGFVWVGDGHFGCLLLNDRGGEVPQPYPMSRPKKRAAEDAGILR